MAGTEALRWPDNLYLHLPRFDEAHSEYQVKATLGASEEHPKLLHTYNVGFNLLATYPGSAHYRVTQLVTYRDTEVQPSIEAAAYFVSREAVKALVAAGWVRIGEGLWKHPHPEACKQRALDEGWNVDY